MARKQTFILSFLYELYFYYNQTVGEKKFFIELLS